MSKYTIKEPTPQYGANTARIVHIPDEVVKQIREDAIDEVKDKIVYHLNDYALQEAPIYQDDMVNQRPVYLAIKNCINGVIEIAEQLKEQKK